MKTKLWFPKKRWRFSTILWISMVLMLIVPGILNLSIISSRVNNALSEKVINQSLEKLEQTSMMTENELRYISSTIGSIAYDSEIAAIASKIHTNSNQLQSEQLEITKLESILRRYFHYNTIPLKSIVFVFNDNSLFIDSLRDDRDTAVIEKQFKGIPWTNKILNEKNVIHVFGVEENKEKFGPNNEYITLAISQESHSYYYDLNIIYFVFDSSWLTNKLESDVENAGELIIIDEYKNVVASRYLQNKLQEKIRTMDLNDRGHFFTEDKLVIYKESDRGWKYVNVLPYTSIIKSTNDIVINILIIGVSFLIVFFLIMIFLVRSINRPIANLVTHMRMVQSGDLISKSKEEGSFEFAMLSKTFNMMIEKIRILINEVKIKEHQKTEAEIAALQSQINPHFLLNTLNAIKIMAMVSNAENIKKMTSSLTKLLASSFNRDGMFAKIKDELELIQDYVHIMKVRFGDKFDLEIHAEESVLESSILKLLLQPIVENAIIHGFSNVDYRGCIKINVTKVHDKITIAIRDNGMGTDQFDKKLKFSGIGIENVNRRIQLHYGSEYGLTIKSVPNEGTEIVMVIPHVSNIESQKG